MSSLSDKHEQMLGFLDAGKVREAAAVYTNQFLPTVKQIYTETPDTYPTRFSKIDDWCSWIKQLYVISVKADKSMNSSSSALAELERIRGHFYALHNRSGTLTVSDLIYAFRTEAAKESPALASLQKLHASIVAQPVLSAKAKDNPAAFEAARQAWNAAVNPLLQKNALTADERTALQKATERFYRLYGVQFE